MMLILLVLIIMGGSFLYVNHQRTRQSKQIAQYESVNQALMKEDYEKASNELEKLADFVDENQFESYRKQVVLVQSAQQQITELEVSKAQKTLGELTKQEKVLEAIQEKQKSLNTVIEKKTEELKSDEQKLDEAFQLSEKKAYQKSSDSLSELADKESKGDFHTLVSQAVELVEKNNVALKQAETEKKEANKTIELTEDEALSIAQSNLPDLFSYGQLWTRIDSGEEGTFTFSGSNSGSFRSILVIKSIDDSQVSVMETRGSNGGEDQVSEYTFQRLTEGEDHSFSENDHADLLDLGNPQKFLDAYSTFSAQGINVMSGNRGSAIVSDQMIAASGRSTEEFYQLDAGIEDYFWNLNNKGAITDEQRTQLILDAKEKLLNGDYANN